MVKVISVSEPAYALLKSRKRASMSFSDVILQALAEKEPEKTEDTQELLAWLRSRARKGVHREPFSQNIDQIVYGASR
jgi:predicted CopG family antitoxin